MLVAIGDLNKRIEIQRVTETVSPLGEVQESWATFATVWAQMTPLSGSESRIGGLLGGTIVYRVIARWRNDVTIKGRILYGTRIFNILAVIDLEEAHRFLRFDCVESV